MENKLKKCFWFVVLALFNATNAVDPPAITAAVGSTAAVVAAATYAVTYGAPGPGEPMNVNAEDWVAAATPSLSTGDVKTSTELAEEVSPLHAEGGHFYQPAESVAVSIFLVV